VLFSVKLPVLTQAMLGSNPGQDFQTADLYFFWFGG
jgi:hypothetical protein